MPKHATHAAVKACAHVAASMSLSGSASNQRVVRSTMVKRYLYLSGVVERGPTRSTCTWVKRWHGTGMGCTAAAGCLVTFARAQCWQSLHHATTSWFIFSHTTRAVRSRRVARIPGWASWRKVSKTAGGAGGELKGVARRG